MIQLHTVPTTEFTWLILEQSEVPDISDFGLLDSLCKETSFDGTKGVVIATTPPVNSGLSGKLYSFCRNLCQWRGSYGKYQMTARKKITGFIVVETTGRPSNSEIVKHKLIEANAPCVMCWQETGEIVPTKSLYCYCEEHRDQSLHRSGSRSRKVE